MKCGKTHDFKIYKQSQNRVHPETKIQVDSGYQGIQKLHANSELPKKRSKKNPLTKDDKARNKLISSDRVIVENVFAYLKKFKIISQRYRNRRKRFGLRFNLVCAIFNHLVVVVLVMGIVVVLGLVVVKVAVTDLLATIERVQPPLPVHAPDQLVKTKPAPGVAVSVTESPLMYLKQFVPQDPIPPELLEIVPVPPVARVKFRTSLKEAVTVFATFINTVQPPVPEQPPPDHPVKIELAVGICES